MEAYTYKGISQGKYVEGEIEALNQDEASFKLKEQQIIITNLIKSKKKKGSGFSLFGKKRLQCKMFLYFLSNLPLWLRLVYQFFKF